MLIKTNGFLFVGDPHLSSITPGRRMDPNFSDTVLDKLAQAGRIADERGLQVVITGDLFDRAKDNQLRMLSKVIKLFQSFALKPLCLIGNHDRAETTLTEGTALELVQASGAVDLLLTLQPRIFEINGQRVLLWGVAHGSTIPDRIPKDIVPLEQRDIHVMVTHHDIAFDRSYPGALNPFEISGVPLVVNGHMHLSRPSVSRGSTVWHNPGNIVRMSLDCKDQVPRVWAWSPELPQALNPIDLEYTADILNMVGRQVDASPEAETAILLESSFSQLLREESRMESVRTDDASLLLEDLQEMFSIRDVSPVAKALILGLYQKRLGMAEGEDIAALPPELLTKMG